MRQDLFDQIAGTVDAIHDVERPACAAHLVMNPLAQPAPERRCLLGESQPEQRIYREGCISHPRVPVVPVTLPADLFGQRGRWRCHDSATRRVGHELQSDCGALQCLPPPARVGGVRKPGSPKPNGLIEEPPHLGNPDCSHGFRLTGLQNHAARLSGRQGELGLQIAF